MKLYDLKNIKSHLILKQHSLGNSYQKNLNYKNISVYETDIV